MNVAQDEKIILNYSQKKLALELWFLDYLKKTNLSYTAVDFSKNETIFKKGAFISSLVFVKMGMVKTVLESDSGKPFILDIGVNNGLVGFSLYKDYEVYPFNLQTLKESQCYLFQLEDIRREAEKNQAFNAFLNDWNRINNMLLFHRTLTIGTKNNFGRLAEAILYFGSDDFAKFEVFKFLTRKDLADYTAMSVESMNKILGELKHDKLIYIENKNIVINDYTMLYRLSKMG